MLKPVQILASAALILLPAGSAMAQFAKPAPIAPVRPPMTARPETGVYDMQSRIYREEAAEAARKQKIAEQKALAESPPDRIARAERVAALLNEGKCKDAAMYALDQGDKEMAAKVANVCRKSAGR